MTKRSAPYQEIFHALVQAVMRAQADVVEWRAGTAEPVPHELINRHFAWLTRYYRAGINRHLFDGADGNLPLRVLRLRGPARLDADVRARLDARESLSYSGWAAVEQELGLVQKGPTRISQLILRAFSEVDFNFSKNKLNADSDTPGAILIKSPLSIVFDYLTVPNMPGSRGYVAVAVRNYIFETFSQFPSGIGNLPDELTFTIADVEEGLSHIWTSMRPRYFSKGQDKLPKWAKSPAGGVLRQHLASKGQLWLRFANRDNCLSYLHGQEIQHTPAPFQYARSRYLETLPDFGELINELWGIPVPIRGFDTLFRGGLRFAARGGLVFGIHGGPGSGKTSLALAIGAHLAPFGVETLYLTGEEDTADLVAKAEALIPDELRRRLSFYPNNVKDWLRVQRFALQPGGDMIARITEHLAALSEVLKQGTLTDAQASAPRPCRAVVVLDGLHDLLMAECDGNGADSARSDLRSKLRAFVVACRDLQALVILASGDDWEGEKAFDYLADVSLRLTHEGMSESGKRPSRRLTLTKGRHQLCALGTHGVQLAGEKGIRLAPQINYQLERQAIWATRVPDMLAVKPVFRRSVSQTVYAQLSEDTLRSDVKFKGNSAQVVFPLGSNIFLNGEGSGGKAALALKIAASPVMGLPEHYPKQANILIISFLYPFEYYQHIMETLERWRVHEFKESDAEVDFDLIHLYPGHYEPEYLFNRIMWKIDEAELQGRPFTAVVIDGLHNVFLQFPEIENYSLIWPQLYTSLKRRPLTILSTYTTFILEAHVDSREYRLDDARAEPLRHSLVQKMDFRIDVDPLNALEKSSWPSRRGNDVSNIFRVKTVAAIGQPIPSEPIYWSRDKLLLIDPDQDSLPFGSR